MSAFTTLISAWCAKSTERATWPARARASGMTSACTRRTAFQAPILKFTNIFAETFEQKTSVLTQLQLLEQKKYAIETLFCF
jgi:hypothetical protein